MGGEGQPLGILFPLFIALLVPFGCSLAEFFSPEHLAALDSEEDDPEERRIK